MHSMYTAFYALQSSFPSAVISDLCKSPLCFHQPIDSDGSIWDLEQGINWLKTAGVWVIYCCVTNNPQNWQLKTVHIYYLTVSVGQGSRHDLAVSSTSWSLMRVPHEAVIKVSAQGLCCHLKVQPGKDLFPISFTWLLADSILCVLLD